MAAALPGGGGQAGPAEGTAAPMGINIRLDTAAADADTSAMDAADTAAWTRDAGMRLPGAGPPPGNVPGCAIEADIAAAIALAATAAGAADGGAIAPGGAADVGTPPGSVGGAITAG